MSINIANRSGNYDTVSSNTTGPTNLLTLGRAADIKGSRLVIFAPGKVKKRSK